MVQRGACGAEEPVNSGPGSADAVVGALLYVIGEPLH